MDNRSGWAAWYDRQELLCKIADADTILDYFSPQWYEYTGLTPEALKDNMWFQTVHPDDRLNSLERWAHCLATGEDHEIEYRVQRHDGVWRWMQGRASRLRNNSGNILKWFGTNTDINDLVEARTSARRTREHLLNVITHPQVTVWAIDKDCRLTLLEGKLM